MRCGVCGSENPAGKRFCKDCGTQLSLTCAACGAELPSGNRFCGDCGAPVALAPAAAAAAVPSAAAVAVASADRSTEPSPAETELRHVSVLFCDIVGFTPMSESQDPAEVREFLSRYFDVARDIVTRYGGVVEKFIGDAVMAVWGAPVAREDDAERAVRAGLDLISAVPQIEHDPGTTLEARVGIVTGRAATASGLEDAIVVGDRVNTAARIEAVAPPGSCYVDETTRDATTAAISYVDRGRHELKGKSEPLRLYEAKRVVAALAGSQRSAGIEAPFSGREHELRLLKELFHGSVERGTARLVLVSGVAGIGKSRLAWELFKYVDGLSQATLWHAGRCLSYGDGISYWALSEIVRARLQIAAEDPPGVALAALRAGLERWVASEEDRAFIEPRLAQLLGLSSDQGLVRAELFAGWRLFFERLAEHLPVVLVIEDLQWADRSLLEFLDQLLDWSAKSAIFMLALTRPEGADRPGLVLGRRNVTTLSLDPLSDEAIGQLVDGLVVGLPADARRRIVERSEGIPLYAVETMRSLLDRGALGQSEDGTLHVTGELGELDVPPELTALISSRLDTLGPSERQLVKECAVLGDSFPRTAVQAVSELDPAELDGLLSALVRREILAVRTDKLSPERGHYAFTQSLIRAVAYGMLTGPERKARHLRTATHLREAFPEEGVEVAEVIASHLHDAYLAATKDADADELRRQAEEAAVAAAERAYAVGADEAAQRAFVRASELAEGVDRARHLVRAARAANDREATPEGEALALEARRIFESLDDAAGMAEAMFELAGAVWEQGRNEEAMEIGGEALRSLGDRDIPVKVRTDLLNVSAAGSFFLGRIDDAQARLEEALLLSQNYELTEQLAFALHFKGVLLGQLGRVPEARLFYEASLAAAKTSAPRGEAMSENNLAWFFYQHDIEGAETHAREALSLARRRGARNSEAMLADTLCGILELHGRFAEAEDLASEVLVNAPDRATPILHARLAKLEALCGRVERAREELGRARSLEEAETTQLRRVHSATAALVEWAAGDYESALRTALATIRTCLDEEGPASPGVRDALPVAVDAGLATGHTSEVADLLEDLAGRPPGTTPPFVKAHVGRGRALLGFGEAGVEDTGSLGEVERSFASLGYEYWQARAQLDLAAGLARRGDGAGVDWADRAARIFDRTGAEAMRDRAVALATDSSRVAAEPARKEALTPSS